MSERAVQGLPCPYLLRPGEDAGRGRAGAHGLTAFNVQLGVGTTRPLGRISTPCTRRFFRRTNSARVVPWLMLHREGLSVLVHPSTGDGYGDHMERSLWLGERLKLNEKALGRGE